MSGTQGCLILSFCLALSGGPTLAAEFEGRQLPAELRLESRELGLYGCGLREMLWADLYLLGLYLPAEVSSVDEIHDPGIAKAFRIEIVYEGSLPEDLPDLWREPLADAIEAEFLEILLELYDQVETGDVLIIAHLPDSGVAITLNGELTVSKPRTDLMPALLERWLGEDPVSGNLRNLLLRGDC